MAVAQPHQPTDEVWRPAYPFVNTWGGRLKWLRIVLDRSVPEMAEMTGITRSTWAAWEVNEHREPRGVVAYAKRIAAVDEVARLGVTEQWLLTGDRRGITWSSPGEERRGRLSGVKRSRNPRPSDVHQPGLMMPVSTP